MGLSFFQVIAVGVMHGMAECPAVIRHKQEAVEYKAHDSFNAAIGVKSVMTALMGDNPAAHRDSAGDDPIEKPQGRGCCRKWDLCANANGQN